MAVAESLSIYETLAKDGVASISATDLFGADAAGKKLLAGLTKQARDWAASPAVTGEAWKFSRHFKRDGIKQFLVKFQDTNKVGPAGAGGLLYQAGKLEAMTSIACEAAGEKLKLHSTDYWFIPPWACNREREWSQSWHFDPEGEHVIKAFLFFDEITDEAGPFQYAIGSHLDTREVAIGSNGYAAQGSVEKSFAPDEIRTCHCPAGTIVFSNTHGLHRGGYTRSQGRLNAAWCWVPLDCRFTSSLALEP